MFLKFKVRSGASLWFEPEEYFIWAPPSKRVLKRVGKGLPDLLHHGAALWLV